MAIIAKYLRYRTSVEIIATVNEFPDAFPHTERTNEHINTYTHLMKM